MEEIKTKVCSKCQQEKSIDRFSKDIKRKYGVQPQCKDCNQSYRLKNIAKIKIANKIWRNTNPDYCKNYRKTHQEIMRKIDKRKCIKNKVSINIRKNNYNRKRRKYDIKFSIIATLRTRNNQILKLQNIIKSYKTLDVIGTNQMLLWNHLEKQFRDGMTRENYGKVWNIDHIIPLSFFDFSDITEIKIANHWGNLRPLFINENSIKSNTIPNMNFSY